MMDMMSRLLATLNQNVGGGRSQNQDTHGHHANTSNNSGGNGNGSNHSSNSGGVPIGLVSRPLQLVFLPKESLPVVVEVPVADEIRACYMEYASLPTEIHDILSLNQSMNQKKRKEGRFDNRYSTPRDYQQALGKVTLAHFDGSNKCTARAWVEKLDNYLSLRPMPEEDAIKFATLHLDGVAHKWWYHGLATLGHNLITTYVEFINKLIERFDLRIERLNSESLHNSNSKAPWTTT